MFLFAKGGTSVYYKDNFLILTTKLSPGIVVKINGHTFRGITKKEIKRINTKSKALQEIN